VPRLHKYFGARRSAANLAGAAHNTPADSLVVGIIASALQDWSQFRPHAWRDCSKYALYNIVHNKGSATYVGRSLCFTTELFKDSQTIIAQTADRLMDHKVRNLASIFDSYRIRSIWFRI